MSCCCFCVSDEPIQDPSGRFRSKQTEFQFQVNMMEAPWASCSSCLWCFGQFIPLTCCCTQYFLRRKVLEYDMTKYQCCQGYLNICGFKAGMCGEESCPEFCLCVESCLCNGFAVSSSRMYVMDKYQLSSDPCDYRMIRINNCIQCMACFCDIASIFVRDLRHLAKLLDHVADCVFHAISGSMTAQVSYEIDYQESELAQNLVFLRSTSTLPPSSSEAVYLDEHSPLAGKATHHPYQQ